MAIADVLIPKLRQRFAERGLEITEASQPCARFPAIHPEVGAIEIHDDGDELTLVFERFTHGHFSNYDGQLSIEQKQEAIVEMLIRFLDAVFADRVVLFGSHEHGGGWHQLRPETTDRHVFPGPIRSTKDVAAEYVWSGPLR